MNTETRVLSEIHGARARLDLAACSSDLPRYLYTFGVRLLHLDEGDDSCTADSTFHRAENPEVPGRTNLSQNLFLFVEIDMFCHCLTSEEGQRRAERALLQPLGHSPWALVGPNCNEPEAKAVGTKHSFTLLRGIDMRKPQGPSKPCTSQELS